MNHKQTRTQGRRGLAILSDLTWVLVFVIGATLIFFLLYKPLIDEKFTRKVNVENLGSDAQYIANSFVIRQADAGVSSGSPGLVADAISDIADARVRLRDADDFEDFVKDSSYMASVESTFGESSDFWMSDGYVPRVMRVTVVLRQGNEYLPGTCREYVPLNQPKSLFCERFESYGVGVPDPDTGLRVPQFRIYQTSETVEVGTAYVPSSATPIMLQVFLTWGSR